MENSICRAKIMEKLMAFIQRIMNMFMESVIDMEIIAKWMVLILIVVKLFMVSVIFIKRENFY